LYINSQAFSACGVCVTVLLLAAWALESRS
jgi:hypothetical protein